jgi:hypothetical protein
MSESRIRKVSGTLGAAGGVVLFLFVGLVPAILYGGWTGLVIAGAFLGHPVPMHLGAKVLIGGGVVLGVLAVGALFAVLGSVVGSLVGAGVAYARRSAAASEAQPAETPSENGK